MACSIAASRSLVTGISVVRHSTEAIAEEVSCERAALHSSFSGTHLPLRTLLPAGNPTLAPSRRLCVAAKGEPMGAQPGRQVRTKKELRSSGGPVRGVPVNADTFFAPGRQEELPKHMSVLSDGERRERLEVAQQQIREETRQREQKLKAKAELVHLDSELKFAKILLAQDQYGRALAHVDKVVSRSPPTSFQHAEATYQKAFCLEQLGRKDEARELYECLVHFRAPFAHVKRRAAEALWRMEGGGPGRSDPANQKSSIFEDYLYQMYLTGFGSYHPKEKYVESGQEKLLVLITAGSVLLMGPVLILWMILQQ